MRKDWLAHWIRRWWRGRKDPLTRLLHDPLLDGPALRITSVEYGRLYPRHRRMNRPKWHEGRLRVDDVGDHYCVRCGIGVREDGSYFDRGATSYGQPTENGKPHYHLSPGAERLSA